MSKFENNLVQGNVVTQLIKFSLPFLISNLIQSLYSVADMVIVGKFSGAASMSGVNIGGQVSFIITNMVFGLCVGGTVLIGQYLGANDRKALKETIGTLFTSLIFLAISLTVIMIAVNGPILKVIQTPPESFDEAKRYFIICMLGTIFIFGYNALSAVMRGMGDSKNPLYFVTIACVTNIVLDLILVAVFKMGASGAAIATVVSQAISMILCIVYLSKNNFIFDFKLKSFGFHKERLKMLLRIGIPTSIQNVSSGISFLFLTALVNTFGFEASAAVGAVGKFNGFAILPPVAMANSISAMSAQNIGAGEIGRAKKTMFVGTAISLIISWGIFFFVTACPQLILEMFVDANDPSAQSVISHGLEYIKAFKFDYLIVPVLFCLNGLYIGSGHTLFTLINGLLSSLLFRIPMSYLFGMAFDLGLMGVGIGAPSASVAALILAIIFYFSGKWKNLVIIKK